MGRSGSAPVHAVPSVAHRCAGVELLWHGMALYMGHGYVELLWHGMALYMGHGYEASASVVVQSIIPCLISMGVAHKAWG